MANARRMTSRIMGTALVASSLLLLPRQTLGLSLQADLAGEAERESGLLVCTDGPEWRVGVPVESSNLRIGGDTEACDSEWAAYLEFDISGIPSDRPIRSASVRIVSGSMNVGGPLMVAAFEYDASGGPLMITRDDLEHAKAIDTFELGLTATLKEIDLSDVMRKALGEDRVRFGLMLVSASSTLGEDRLVSISGPTSAAAPSLEVRFQQEVDTASASWSRVKAGY